MDLAELGLRVNSDGYVVADQRMRQFDKTGQQVEKRTTGLNSATSTLMRSVIGLASAYASMRTVTQTIRTFAEFQQSMAQVQAVTRATTAEFAQLNAVAREMGATTEFTASQAASALRFMGMAGFEAAEAVSALPDVLNLATAASMDLGRAADISSNIMSAFGIAAENASRVTDVLAAASSRANTDVDQLGSAMAYVGPVAAAMGVDIGDAAAAVGVLSDAGIQGSAAGTGLRRVLSSLANPTAQARRELASLGISMNEVNPATNDLTDIIDRLSVAGIDAAQALTIFGDRGGPALLALVENNPRLRELTGILTDVEGESARMAATMRDTLTGDFKTLQSAVQDVQITLVEALNPALRQSTQSMAEMVRMIGDFGQSEGFASWVQGVADSLNGIQIVFAETWEAFNRYILPIESILEWASRFEGVTGHLHRALNPLAALGDIFQSTGREARLSAQQVAQKAESIENLRKTTQSATKILRSFSAVISDARPAMAEVATSMTAAERANRAYAEVLQRAQPTYAQALQYYARSSVRLAEQERSVKALIDSIKEERAMLGMTNAEQRIYNYLKGEGKNHTEEQREEVIGHINALYEERDALNAVGEQATATGAQFGQMEMLVRRSIERMRDVIGDFFQRMILDGELSFRSLADGFKRLIAEMIATAAANRIIIGLGMGGASSMASASGGLLSQGAGMLSGMGNALSSGLIGLGQMLPGAMGQAVFNAYGKLASAGGSVGLSGGASVLGGAAMSAGAGLAGGWAGQQLFGGNAQSNWGAGIGAVAGTMLGGPLGSLIGSFVGGAIDSLTGGDGRQRVALGVETDARIQAGARGMTGYQVEGASGIRYTGRATRADEGAANQLVDIFATIDNALTAFTGAQGALRGRSLGGRSSQAGLATQESGINSFFGSAEFNQLVEDDINSATGLFIKAWLDAASDVVDQTFAGLIRQTPAENILEMVDALSGIMSIQGRDPIQAARDQHAAQQTLLSTYTDVTGVLRTLSSEYDGSLHATQRLAEVMAIQQQSAYELATAYLQVQSATSALFGNLSESIRLSLMDQEELYNYQRDQAEALAASIETMSDPQSILAAAQEIEQRIGGMWGRLGEDQQQEMGQGFLDYITSVNDLVQSRLESGMSSLEQSQTEINQQLRDDMADAAQLNIRAAQMQMDSANIINNAARIMQTALSGAMGSELRA